MASTEEIGKFIKDNFDALPIMGGGSMDSIFEIIKLWEMEKAREKVGSLKLAVKVASSGIYDPDLSTIKIVAPAGGEPGKVFILGKQIEDGEVLARIIIKVFGNPCDGYEADILDFMSSPESNHSNDVELLRNWERYRLRKVAEDVAGNGAENVG